MEYWTILLSIVINVICIHYLFQAFNYFKRHNVICAPSIPIIGSMLPVVLRQLSFTEFTQKLYNFNRDAKYFGFYFTTKPIILLRDPELIKDTFVRNFDTFLNRHGFHDINDQLMSENLFSLQGQRWKDMRTLLTPAFTSSKMKHMFTLVLECAVNTSEFMSRMNDKEVDIKNIFSKYTNDVIASCAFGIKVDSIKNPKNKFYVYGREITNMEGLRAIKFILCMRLPALAKIFNLKIIRTKVENFFKDILKDTITAREAKNITRPDMIQLMIDIKNKQEKKLLNIDEMAAQVFVFYFGGFETSSTIMSFAAHEIATNPDVQAKLQEEIDATLEESNGEVTYEIINRMKYLNMVMHEVLRLYPTVAFIERTCQKDYELLPALPNEKPYVVKKGQIIWAPVYAIHRDKKYFENPTKFYPERFLDKNVHLNSSYYIPFGLGPRMCIAGRFALLQIKTLLFHVLARCELKPCPKTMLSIKLKKNLFMAPANGFWLNVQRRSNMHPTIKSGKDDGINS